MEFGTFVALRSPLGILALARAELTEILGRLWGYVGKELHLFVSILAETQRAGKSCFVL